MLSPLSTAPVDLLHSFQGRRLRSGSRPHSWGNTIRPLPHSPPSGPRRSFAWTTLWSMSVRFPSSILPSEDTTASASSIPAGASLLLTKLNASTRRAINDGRRLHAQQLPQYRDEGEAGRRGGPPPLRLRPFRGPGLRRPAGRSTSSAPSSPPLASPPP